MEGRVTRSGKTTSNLSTKPQPPTAASSRQRRRTRSDDVYDTPADEHPKRQTKRARHVLNAKRPTTTPTSNNDDQSVAVVINQAGGRPGHRSSRPRTRGVKQKSNNHQPEGDDNARQTSYDGAFSDKRKVRKSRRNAPQPPNQSGDKINQQDVDIEFEQEGRAERRSSERSQSASDGGFQPPPEQTEDEAEDEEPPESDEDEQGSHPRTVVNIMYSEPLQSIIEISEQVGHKGKKQSASYEAVLQNLKLRTPLGKKMNQKLKLLNTAYTKLQDAKLSKDSATLQDRYGTVSLRIQNLTETIGEIINAGFGGPRVWAKSSGIVGVKSLLVDLYFNLLPMLLKCIKLGIETHDEDERINVPVLKEFESLIDLYWNLAKAALKLPAEIQPVADDCIPEGKVCSTTFQIKQPTQKALGELLPHRKQLKERLSNIERTEKDAENFKLRAEREKMIQTEREREIARRIWRRLKEYEIRSREQESYSHQLEQEKQRRIEEVHRLQRETLEIYRASRQIDPRTNPLRGPAVPVSSRVMQGYHTRSQYEDADEDEDEDDSDPFADDYSPRVRVFPNNNKKSKAPVEWSDRQRAMFIECMRLEQGYDKYERAAEELQCSMDEVFTYAKDLQEAMDAAHEKGTMNSEEDEWTYDIWVEQERPRMNLHNE